MVHEDEERALDLDHVLKTLELQSWALENGEAGWNEALIEESADTYGELVVLTLNQLACNRRQYLIVHGACAIAVQPSGSLAALREEARHYGARVEAILDVRHDLPIGVAYDVSGVRLSRRDAGALHVSADACSFEVPLQFSYQPAAAKTPM
ncbi:MAG TPA: hypothetical protein VFL13_11940 [Candidatus Baltobacteraceae bacterium]|nr:hypothetical protein [Candidatus Baltobacteraceae bacterium]